MGNKDGCWASKNKSFDRMTGGGWGGGGAKVVLYVLEKKKGLFYFLSEIENWKVQPVSQA
jgi:hypothetical protein